MTLIRKLSLLFALAALWAPTACKEESAKKDQGEAHPAVAELLQAIDKLQLAEARGVVLSGASDETRHNVNRIVDRSKMGALLLRNDDSNLDGLTEVVRSRDELKSEILLTEDVDVISTYRAALEKAVREICAVQGRKAYELGDPNFYRALYSQTFDLQEKLGDFGTFVETKTAKGPKLFEAATCGAGCGNQEYALTVVNKDQTVWLVSPRMSLPDSEGTKMIFQIATSGFVTAPNIKGLRVFASETFTGHFTRVDDGWTEITEQLDKYPANDANFKNLTSAIPLDAYRGKSVAFAFRVQGATKALTTYEFKYFNIMGKGNLGATKFGLTTPEPLLITAPVASETKCEIVGGVITATKPCRFSFAKDDFNSLVAYADLNNPKADSPFRKYVYDKGFVPPTRGGGWKPGDQCGGTADRPEPELQDGFCVNRAPPTSRDLLVTPKIKADSDLTIKIRYAVVGPTVNADTPSTRRLRVLAFDEIANANKALQVTKLDGATIDFLPDQFDFDLEITQGYTEAAFVKPLEAKLGELQLNTANLINDGSKPFRLAFFQYLNGKTSPGTTIWYVYSIDFVSKD